MQEKIDFGKHFDSLDNFKLPFIKQNEKMLHFENQIKNFNKYMTLLEKEMINNNTNDNNQKEKNTNINTKVRFNNTPKNKNNNNFITTHFNIFNSFKKRNSSYKKKLTQINKNPLRKINSTKNLINKFMFHNSDKLPSITNFKIRNSTRIENKNINPYLNIEYRNNPSLKIIQSINSNSNDDSQTEKGDKENHKPNFNNILNNISITSLSHRSSYKDDTNQHNLPQKKILKLNMNNIHNSNPLSFDKDVYNLNPLTLSNKVNINKNNDEDEDEKSILDLLFNIKEKGNLNNKVKYRDRKTQVALINLIKKLRKKNLKIKNNLRNCKFKFEEMNFCLGTKLKYSKWKYEISDYEKYFIDIEHFGERELKEIERKKTFYDFFEDAVDTIIEKRNEKKYLLSNNKRKNIKEKKVNNIPDSEIAKLKQKNVHSSLENIIKRKSAEKAKRSKIKKILRESLSVVI